MKTIKVYLQYPWKFPDSSYCKNIIDYPPENVEFVNYNGRDSKKIGVIGSSKKFEYVRLIKNAVRRIMGILRMPNLTFSVKNNADLIHCAHCLSLNNKPWVVDAEIYDVLGASTNISSSKLGKYLIKNRLESHNCKKIIAWSEDCRKTFEEAFPNNKKISSKIEVLPFALPSPKFSRLKHHSINLLFVARWFECKGGKQALYAMDKLTRLHKDINCTVISRVPKKFKEKYAGNRRIKILELVSQEDLFKKFYPSADIFLYPGIGDTYGGAMPEALSFGLPVVTVDSFARKEIVRDGKTGIIVERPHNFLGCDDMNPAVLEGLVKAASKLITNKKLRMKMSQEAINEVKFGKFSIAKRNRLLKDIYQKALKGYSKGRF